MKLDLKSYEEKKLNMFFIQLRQFLAKPDNTLWCDIWQYFNNTSKYFKYLQIHNYTW
jgi:hypothetical protein